MHQFKASPQAVIRHYGRTAITSSTISRRLPSLTGLRFIAALLVVLSHLNVTSWFLPVNSTISFFFVLSGFVLTWSARPGDSVRSTWRRRFWRIAPNHVVNWALMMALLAVTGMSLVPTILPPGPTPPGPATANLLLVQSWVPSYAFLFSVNPQSWSLSSEILFYALFPVMLPLVRCIPVRRLGLTAIGLIALTWMMPLVSLTFSGPVVVPGLLKSQYWFDYFFPPSRLPEFVLGMVLARMVQNGFTPRLGVALPGIGVVGFLNAAIAIELPHPFILVAATIIPVALLVLGGASMDVREARSLWRNRSMVILGEMTYSIYLVHVIVIEVVSHLLGAKVQEAIGVFGAKVLTIVLCLVAAWALYCTVERPLVQRFGSPAARSRPAASPPLVADSTPQ